MCLLRKITYDEFSEFIRQKKITYKVGHLSTKLTYIYWSPLTRIGGPDIGAPSPGSGAPAQIGDPALVEEGEERLIWLCHKKS